MLDYKRSTHGKQAGEGRKAYALHLHALESGNQSKRYLSNTVENTAQQRLVTNYWLSSYLVSCMRGIYQCQYQS